MLEDNTAHATLRRNSYYSTSYFRAVLRRLFVFHPLTAVTPLFVRVAVYHMTMYEYQQVEQSRIAPEPQTNINPNRPWAVERTGPAACGLCVGTAARTANSLMSLTKIVGIKSALLLYSTIGAVWI